MPCRAASRSPVVASASAEFARSAGSAASRRRLATISARCCSSTCSAKRSSRTSLHAATTTTSVTPQTSSAISLKLRVMYRRRGGRYRPAPPAVAREPDLGEHPDHDAPVLRAALFGLVRRDRLLAAVADDVHLVQRNLVLFEEVALHDLGALHADLLVDDLAADVVGVAFDLDEGAIRIALQLVDHLVDLGLGLIGQIGLAELELPFVLADDDGV